MSVLGDRHNGRSTEHLQFGGGEVIRKYRCAAAERAFSAFLKELSALGMADLPACAQVLNETAAYHDEAVVAHTPAAEEAAVKRCFRAEGTLLFLAYLLGSVDLHAENLIVCGDTPVVVDLETLLAGTPARGHDSRGSLMQSVMRAHLLPNFLLTEQGVRDCSGLSGVTADGKNLPLLGGQAVFPWQYPQEVTRGFCAAYEFALANRAQLAALLPLFSGCRSRQLLRPTQTYGVMLELLARVDDGQKEPVARAMLARAYQNDIDPKRSEQTAQLLQAETDALLRGDVPLFTCFANGVDLYDKDTCVLKNHLACSPVEFAEKRLAALSRADEASQRKLILLSLSAATPLAQARKSTRTALAQLEHCAVGSLYSGWTMLDHDARGNIFFQSVGYGLYDGLCGILCAYAACGEREKLARHYRAYRRARVLSGESFPLFDRSAGLQVGLGGEISALLHIAELTGDGQYADDAACLAGRIATQPCAQLTGDVLGGAAGLALCLPKLPRALALPLAKTLSDALKNAQTPLTGAAHGAAGLALALGALQTVLQSDCFDEKILSLLRQEDESFDATAGNWPDLRNPQRHGFMSGWCSGAPGIGMTRKRLLSYTKNDKILALCAQDIARAAAFLQRRTPTKRDSLCCGAAARLMAASMLGVTLQGAADALTADTKSPRFTHRIDTADDCCGLMQGLAGVLYARATEGNPKSGGMLL